MVHRFHEDAGSRREVGLAAESTRVVLDEIDLYLTMNCNLSCKFCSVKANEYHHEELPLGRIQEIISEACHLGLKHLHLTGGEPTLREDLEQVVEYASDKGIATRLITNGTLLSADRIRKLKDVGLAGIMISIDGMEATHDYLRGSSGSWRLAMDCVTAAVESGLSTRVSSVAFCDNAEELPDLMETVGDLGANIFSVFLGSPLGRGVDWQDHVLEAQSWREFQRLLAARVDNLDNGSMEVIVEQGFIWRGENESDRTNIRGRGAGCSTLMDSFDYLIVRSDGNLYQCVFFIHDGQPLGNVRERSLESTLDSALDVSAYAKFIQPAGSCNSCNWLRSCGGGCRGYAKLYTGSWFNVDPRCGVDLVSADAPAYYPACPIAKLNIRTGFLGGSSEQALSEGQ